MHTLQRCYIFSTQVLTSCDKDRTLLILLIFLVNTFNNWAHILEHLLLCPDQTVEFVAWSNYRTWGIFFPPSGNVELCLAICRTLVTRSTEFRPWRWTGCILQERRFACDYMALQTRRWQYCKQAVDFQEILYRMFTQQIRGGGQCNANSDRRGIMDILAETFHKSCTQKRFTRFIFNIELFP
jgi:hypothetical protein